jgi:hypothetical protein
MTRSRDSTSHLTSGRLLARSTVWNLLGQLLPMAVGVATITLLALMVAIVTAFSMEAMERAREDPQFAARLQLFRFYLSRSRKPPNLEA